MSVVKSTMKLVKSRVEPIFAWPWSALIACLMAGRGFPPILVTVLAVLSMMLITSSVYIYNDIVDKEMDQYNFKKKNRPLVTGEVSVRFAQYFVAITAVLGLALAYFINWNVFVWSSVYFLLFFVYSYPLVRLKKMYVVKEIIIALVIPMSSVIGSYAVLGSFSLPIIYAGTTMGLFLFLMMPALNDSFDVDEDKIYGIKTLAQTLSWRIRTYMMASGILLMVVLTYTASVWFNLSIVLPVATLVASLLILRVLSKIWDKFERDYAYGTRIKFQMYFFAIQILFVLSNMNLPFLNLL
jgi:4-hydroxybenzoate polyprenyltransferase